MKSILCMLALLIGTGGCQLVVNVKDKGGDIVKETIIGNTTLDVITLDFQKCDGTIVTQLIDFANEIQIFKIVVLGEEERGEPQYQIMCFINRFIKNEFISADAMSKLRQKNPGAVRQPEDDKGVELIQTDMSVLVERSSVISPHIAILCRDAVESTYVREADLRGLSNKSQHKGIEDILAAVKRDIYQTPRCMESTDLSKHCTCQLELCIPWYPCGLKYCRGKDSTGKPINYRCGIKTCRKCRIFDYYVRAKQMCMWDESTS